MQQGASGLKRLFLNYRLFPALRRSAFIQATSAKEAHDLKALDLEAKTRVLPLGVNMPQENTETCLEAFRNTFPELAEKPFVLCLSRIHPIKRLDLALEAFAQLKTRQPDCHCVIAGGPSDHQQELIRMAKDWGISEQVHFIGFLKGAAKSGAYFSARAFLQTSEHENFGMTVMESLGHGLKVVCTAGVAAGEHVRASQGGQVTSDAPEAIAEALNQLVSRPDSNRNQEVAQWAKDHFSWEAVVRQLEVAYRACIP